MGDEDDGAALPVELLEELQHLLARPGVQRAGGLIRHDDRGMGGDGPGDGDPLLLAAGHLGGIVPAPVGQAHPLQRLQRQLLPVDGIDAPVDEGQLHILLHGEGLDEVILLEDEADLLVADAGELAVGEVLDVRAVQKVGAPGGDVQAAQDVHEGGLAAAGLAHHGHELPVVDGQRDAVQRADLALQALAVDLVDIPQFNEMLCHRR